MSGCATYSEQARPLRERMMAGNFVAAEQATHGLGSESGKDGLVVCLEKGATLRAAGRVGESAVMLERADRLFEKEMDAARIRIGQTVAAFVVNPAQTTYGVRLHEGIMLSVYQALNYMELGNMAAARVNVERAFQRQVDSVRANSARIAAEQKRRKSNADVARALDHEGMMTSTMAQLTASIGDLQGYAEYVNPFAAYLDGLFHMVNAQDADDVERGRKFLERAASFAPENTFVRADLERLSNAQALMPRRVYVVLETGLAPYREEVEFSLPILVSRVSYVGFAFPKLEVVGGQVPYVEARAGGKSARTLPVANMDRVVGQAFRDELPGIIFNAVASAVAKLAAAYVVNDAMRDQHGKDSVEVLLTELLTMFYQAFTNVADTRCWSTLPKEFQVCYLDFPENRELQLAIPGGATHTVALPEGQVVMVYVKAVNQPNAVSVRAFKLK